MAVWRWIAVGLALGLGLGFAVARRPVAGPRPVVERGPLGADEAATIKLFAALAPSVVYITTVELQQDFFRAYEVPRGTGSGFVWDEAGHVVTNYHVVAGASRVQVGFDGPEYYDARLVGAAPDMDLAVLAVRAPKALFRPMPVGRSNDLQVGQRVLAIGNPFGLDRSLTTGVVSALDRSIQAMTGRSIEGVIQTDASINPGNSGGPLLDSAGRLIGINTAIRSPTGASAGVGFAVPVDTVNRVVPQLISYGKVVRPTLGVRVDHDQRVRGLGLEGVLVLGVVPGGPAERAGLRGVRREAGRLVLGDLIVAIGDRAVRRNEDLLQVLEAHDPGDAVVVRYQRGSTITQATVTLALPQVE